MSMSYQALSERCDSLDEELTEVSEELIVALETIEALKHELMHDEHRHQLEVKRLSNKVFQ